MIFRPFWIVLGLTLYVPFESFLLKWLPVSDSIYVFARLGSELILYSLLVIVLIHKMVLNGGPLRKTPIDKLVLLFVVLAVLSIAYNGASFIGGIINIRTLLRYLAVYYIVVNMNISKKQSKLLLRAMIIVGVFESVLGIAQYFGGERLTTPFLPRLAEVNIANRELDLFSNTPVIGSVAGTFGLPAPMASYLLITLVILTSTLYLKANRIEWKSESICLVILFLGIVVTYKRGPLLIGLMILPTVLYLYKRKLLLIKFSIVATVFIIVATIIMMPSFNMNNEYVSGKRVKISLASHVMQLADASYWNNSFKVSRGWVLTEVSGAALTSGKLLGFSPDETFARAELAKSGPEFRNLIYFKALDDVYWVSILIYYGVAGLIVFVLILLQLYIISKYLTALPTSFAKLLGVILYVLILVTVPLTFLERTFEFRAFGFYFWLLAGLMMSEYLRLKTISRISNG